MSIAQGIQLGLSLSRGARDEVRRDEMLAAQKAQIQRDNDYQDKVRPLQLDGLRQDLANSQAYQAHLAEMRPLQVDAAKQGLAQATAEEQRRKEAHTVGLATEKQRQSAIAQDMQYQQEAYKRTMEDADTQKRAAWVQQQAPYEWARFQSGGQFSDRFLQESGAVGSPLSPERLLDTNYVNSLDTLNNMLDPKHKESAADKGKLMQSLNTVFAPQLNIGGTAPNGSPIKSREITDLHPVVDGKGKVVPGKFYVNLRVTPEQGEPYDAPLTMNRSADPKDPVKPIDLGDVVNMVRSQQFFSKAVNASPETQQRLKSHMDAMRKTGKADDMTWNGKPRKFSDVMDIYKNDKTLQAPDGTPMVSFADFEWTEGDPAKLDHVRKVAQMNLQTQQQAAQAMQEGDKEEAAKLQAQFMSASELWEFAQQQQTAKEQDAKRAEAAMTASSARNPKELQAYQAKNPKWYLEPDLPASARKQLTAPQWQERAAARQQSEQAMQQENKADRSAQLQDIQKRGLADFSAQYTAEYLNGIFPNLTKQQQQAWFDKNRASLSDEQQTQAQTIIQSGTR